MFVKGEETHSMDLVAAVGEEKIQELINFGLRHMGGIHLPRKRGTFVECRRGMVNLCPVGRSIDQEGRNEFARLDESEGIRDMMIDTLKIHLGEKIWTFAKGGQISIDCYPCGWDKRFCLNYIQSGVDVVEDAVVVAREIHFFGDRCQAGGNDFEIYHDRRVIGHSVKGPTDTIAQCVELFGL